MTLRDLKLIVDEMYASGVDEETPVVVSLNLCLEDATSITVGKQYTNDGKLVNAITIETE